MNFLKIILLFQLIKTSIFQIEINIDWKKYISSDSLTAYSKKIKSLNGIESFKYLKSIDLSSNQIKEIDSLKNLTSLGYLYLSNNQIKEIDSLKNLTSLRYLYLSNNQIKEIDSLQLYKSKTLSRLNLFHNQIENVIFNMITISNWQIYLSTSSSFNLSVLNDSINQYNQIYVFSDLKYLDSSNIYNQKKYSKLIKSINYYRSANLIQLNNMFHSDCLLTIDYLRRRIHFNLFLYEQIDHFFSKCQKYEFDF